MILLHSHTELLIKKYRLYAVRFKAHSNLRLFKRLGIR